MRLLKLKKNAQKTKISKNSNNFAVIAILGDFEEFEGPVPEPPYPYHQIDTLFKAQARKMIPYSREKQKRKWRELVNFITFL